MALIDADSLSAHPGELVPAEFEGVVASIHTGLVNIELRDRTTPAESRYFVSLVTNPRDRTALSVFLDDRRRGGLTANATVGAQARGTPEGLRVPGLPPLRYADAAGGSADLRPTGQRSVQHAPDRQHSAQRGPRGRRFSGRLELSATRVSAITDPATHRALRATLLGNPTYRRGLVPLLAPAEADASEEPFVTRARSILGLQVGAEDSSRASGSDPALLIGLGPGFTPAGDDFLAGAILAEDLSKVPVTDRRNLNRETVRAGLHRTTTGGATILKLALDGRPPLFVHAVCDILSCPDLSVDDRTAEAAAIAARFGHSSGMDLLTGFLWWTGDHDGGEV